MRARGGVASLAEYRTFDTARFAKDLRAITKGGHERIVFMLAASHRSSAF